MPDPGLIQAAAATPPPQERGATFPMSRDQVALADALRDVAPVLDKYYRGALTVLHDEGNADRLALCAHGVRELIEKLPAHRSLPSRAGINLGTEVANLSPFWSRAEEQSACHTSGDWIGTIDPSLRKVLKRLSKFFNRYHTNRGPRTEEARTLLRDLDRYSTPLPKAVEELRVAEWLQHREYFTGVSHHKQTDEVTFCSQLQSLEALLIDWLLPRTFEDRSVLDALIREGEGR